MKKLFLAFFIVLVQLIVFDVLAELVGTALLKHMPYYTGYFAKDNYRLNYLNSDIVIVGPSTAAHDYVTSILNDSISQRLGYQYTSFNAGMDAMFVSGTSMAVESILDRYKPKLLIIDVREVEFYVGNDFIIDHSSIYYFINKTVKKYCDDYDRSYKYKLMIGLYRFNSKFVKILLHYIGRGDDTGYEPLYQVMAPSDAKEISKNNSNPINEYSLKHFNDALDACQKKNVKVVVVSSPVYGQLENNSLLEKIVKGYGFAYIDMANDEYFSQNPLLFNDVFHLNDKGAKQYTSIVAKKILDELDGSL